MSPVAVVDVRLYGMSGRLRSVAKAIDITENFPRHMESIAHIVADAVGGGDRVPDGTRKPMKRGGGNNTVSSALTAPTYERSPSSASMSDVSDPDDSFMKVMILG